MKKKIISIILILVLLLLPFGVLLNVKAEDLETTNGITYDKDSTNGDGYKIRNSTTATVTVNGIGENAVMAMYKILDVYYNPTSNQMSYGFTSNFGTFAQAQNPSITVSDYLGKTYDPNGDYDDNSQFNALVSQYAQYVRANNVSATYSMTTAYDSNEEWYYAAKANAEAGVYLILPSVNSPGTIPLESFDVKSTFVYSVMIANLVPMVSNGAWTFSGINILSKSGDSWHMSALFESDIDGIAAMLSGQAVINYGLSLNYIANNDYSFLILRDPVSLPSNPHSSIAALVTNNILNMVDIIYPATLAPDLTEVKYFTGERLLDARIANNKYYVTSDEDPPVEYEFANITTSTGKMPFDYSSGIDSMLSIVFNLDINSATLSNAVAGNTITTVSYNIKDPYVDIGSNVTQADVRAAFDTSDANYSSSKSVAIRRSIEKVEKSVTLYVTGVTVNNTNSSSNALAGGEFAVYGSYDSSTGVYSNQLGSNIVMDSNGTGLLNGLDPTHTYYLKQVKAPSGYRLYDEKIIVLPGSSDNTQYDSSTYQVVSVSNGMYTANVVNSPVLALPFTGGSGTVIYTIIGLLIVVGAGIFLVIYKKKNKKKD